MDLHRYSRGVFPPFVGHLFLGHHQDRSIRVLYLFRQRAVLAAHVQFHSAEDRIPSTIQGKG